MAVFSSKIEVAGGVVRGKIGSNPRAGTNVGEGFYDLGWRECLALRDELEAMAKKMQAIEGAIK